ncbi:hypothetical protein BDD12DRAFT_872536 [Trichophaea hybrida]|nr:hypothetical protein BDD12DRAFT_872536 [Trichophaea hybrida]
MPIKFLKFTRRKSVGNALEAEYEPANQGIHQDEHETGRESVGSGFRVLPQRHRGSGQTNSSANSSTDYYGGSSNRLSSNSTLPSTDAPQTPDDYRPVDLYSSYTNDKSQAAGTSSSSGNTLSPPSSRNRMSIPKLETTLDTTSLFGDDMFDFSSSKKDKKDGSSSGIGSLMPTAPKIASNSIINPSNNHYNIPPVPLPKSYDPEPPTSRFPPSPGAAYTNIFANSHHIDADRPSNNESSPYHWDSKPSDGLLTNVAVSNTSRNPRNLTPGQKPAPLAHTRTDSLEAPSIRPVQKRNSGDASGLKRTSPIMRSLPFEDEDAAIVASSVNNSRQDYGSRPQPNHSKSSPTATQTTRRLSDKSKDRDSGWEETIPSGSSSDHSVRLSGSSKETKVTSPTSPANNAPTAKKTGLVGVQLVDDPSPADDFDLSFSAALAAKYESSEPTQQIPANRVMTRAQFERCQQQQDDQRRLSGKAAEEEEDSDMSDYEEESEAEKNRELARQRARQEAHLSVYRQQMMKISGTDPSDAPLLGMNTKQGSISTPALPLGYGGMDPGSSGKNSDSEDEEVPLGILMAHGFPTKNRPPTRLSNSSSQPNLRAAAQNQHDPRLPPFARHLPQDPYNLGASIVNPMNRMPLAFGGGSDARSVVGGSVYGGMPPSQPSGRGPQGLVGEIMRAEEQKAARRGMGGGGRTQFVQPHTDPFKPDPFDRPASRGGGGLLGGTPNGGMGAGVMGGNNMGMGMGMGMGAGAGMGMGMGMGGGMGGMPMPGGMDPMQAQMATMQQQYMQMQMQMQMMQMIQMRNNSQQQLMSQMSMMEQQRPTSVMSMNPQMSGLGAPQQNQRAMSLVDSQFPQVQPNIRNAYAPSIAPSQQLRSPAAVGNVNAFLGPQGYTPSIAPSERSTVGQPSRYRPVTYQTGTSTGARTSTLTSGSAGHDWNKKSPGPSHLKNSTTESDDDESGWEELNKKRKEKADGWKKKKETGGLKGMLNFGSTAASSNPSPA